MIKTHIRISTFRFLWMDQSISSSKFALANFVFSSDTEFVANGFLESCDFVHSGEVVCNLSHSVPMGRNFFLLLHNVADDL